MSKRRWILGCAMGMLAPLVALDAQAAVQAAAQDAATIRRVRLAMERALRADQAELTARRERLRTLADDTVTFDGVRIAYPRAAVTAADRAALAKGIAAARQALEKQFGSTGLTLLDGQRWEITVPSQRGNNGPTVLSVATPGANGGTHRSAIRAPIDPQRAEFLALSGASQRVLDRQSALLRFTRNAYALRPDAATYFVARRSLATSHSSVARSCATGAIAACRTVLDPDAGDRRFGPEDTDRGRPPIADAVRGSLLGFVLQRGGEPALRRLLDAAPGAEADAVRLLAEAAGETPDAMLAAWNAELRRASASRAGASLPMLATTLGWSLLFLAVAPRRRPR